MWSIQKGILLETTIPEIFERNWDQEDAENFGPTGLAENHVWFDANERLDSFIL